MDEFGWKPISRVKCWPHLLFSWRRHEVYIQTGVHLREKRTTFHNRMAPTGLWVQAGSAERPEPQPAHPARPAAAEPTHRLHSASVYSQLYSNCAVWGNIIRKEGRTFLMRMRAAGEKLSTQRPSPSPRHWHAARGKSTTGALPVQRGRGDARVQGSLMWTTPEQRRVLWSTAGRLRARASSCPPAPHPPQRPRFHHSHDTRTITS